MQDLEALPMAETSKAILIDGIDNELFRSGISRFVIGCDDALSLLTNHQAVVLELKGRELSDITGRYLARSILLWITPSLSLWPILCTVIGSVPPGIRSNKTFAGYRKLQP